MGRAGHVPCCHQSLDGEQLVGHVLESLHLRAFGPDTQTGTPACCRFGTAAKLGDTAEAKKGGAKGSCAAAAVAYTRGSSAQAALGSIQARRFDAPPRPLIDKLLATPRRRSVKVRCGLRVADTRHRGQPERVRSTAAAVRAGGRPAPRSGSCMRPRSTSPPASGFARRYSTNAATLANPRRPVRARPRSADVAQRLGRTTPLPSASGRHALSRDSRLCFPCAPTRSAP